MVSYDLRSFFIQTCFWEMKKTFFFALSVSSFPCLKPHA